jgi:hypothetical protein
MLLIWLWTESTWALVGHAFANFTAALMQICVSAVHVVTQCDVSISPELVGWWTNEQRAEPFLI